MKKGEYPARKIYRGKRLSMSSAPREPISLFRTWFKDALRISQGEPTAMSLATVDKTGRPSVRMVLLKEFSARGFVFYTNYKSRKGMQLVSNTNVASVFFWPELERQLRIEGIVEKVSRKESVQYFSTRPRGSQLGAWVSRQSAEIFSEDALESELARMEKKFKNKNVPCPPQWGGYRIIPNVIEFWSGQPNRLHDRIEYRLINRKWVKRRLAP